MYSCCRCIVGLADSRGGGVSFSVRAGLYGGKNRNRSSAEARIFARRSSDNRTPPATGLSTMSSLLGTVRKQLKSHPAVSPDRRALLELVNDPVTLTALGRTRCGGAPPPQSNSHLNNLTYHQCLSSVLFMFVEFSGFFFILEYGTFFIMGLRVCTSTASSADIG